VLLPLFLFPFQSLIYHARHLCEACRGQLVHAHMQPLSPKQRHYLGAELIDLLSAYAELPLFMTLFGDPAKAT
jgi:hypothetical protein